MGIFRRKDKTAESVDATEQDVQAPVVDDASTDADTDTGTGVDADVETATDTAPDTATDTATDTAVAGPSAETPVRVDSREVDRSNGPFDRSEVDDIDGYLDFGSLAILPTSAMELRLDVDEAGQEITGLTAIIGESACQMQVFAAPRTTGVWDGIRGEIHDNLLSSGGTAEDRIGELGHELHVRMPATGPDGRTTWSPATFLGVDRPRWFLRAVFSGRAAMEEDAFAELLQFMRATVVTRGGEPRAPREMLPLQLPEGAEPGPEPESMPASDEQLPNPFDRGPEITEIR